MLRAVDHDSGACKDGHRDRRRLSGFPFDVSGLGFRVSGFGFGGWGLGFRGKGFGFRAIEGTSKGCGV